MTENKGLYLRSTTDIEASMCAERIRIIADLKQISALTSLLENDNDEQIMYVNSVVQKIGHDVLEANKKYWELRTELVNRLGLN